MNLSDISPYVNEPVKKTTEELIKEYCAAIDTRLLWVLGFAMLMWLAEPKIRQLIELKLREYDIDISSQGIMMLYRFLGIGLLAIVGIGIYII